MITLAMSNNYVHCSNFYPLQVGKVTFKAFTMLLLIKGEQHPFLLSHLQVATNLWLVKSLFFLSLVSLKLKVEAQQSGF